MRCERVLLDGTVRALSPEDTWAGLAPQLPRYGITRVASLTGLDYLGLPVWTAIRPGSQTLTASQGKGSTDLLAKISAVMEAVELWHAEQPMAPAMSAPARDVELPYPLAALPVKVWHDALERVPLEWTMGAGVISGHTVPVPLGLLQRSARRPTWQPDVFRATSTGLACGNGREEAMLHAMYEVVERDALFADERSGGARRTLVDPRSVDDPYCRTLIDRLLGAHAALELAVVDNAYGIPVCLAYLWSEDYPIWFAGAGCHTDPHIALSRAISEAAQSRLTCIAGTRDDLVSHEEAFDAPPPRPQAAEDLHPWAELANGCEPWRGCFADQAQAVAARIGQVTGHEPVCLDLSAPADPLAAVKVICPGTKSRTRRSIPR
ncbi:YcaO-like family protein [Streptomyces sp. A3M-1-3]|uniref:YcaO-like family protein n=1 Tax=Streptomyces sp. A3M-1-3 TaxID=2962044 RepID=UPI0020B83A37|nr:YcaO-like family protein [Streptomyces sp. A3M-1-3]MCP3822102.1 YcaO-like family protein [Streptomyces sp. A3M-1-3]